MKKFFVASAFIIALGSAFAGGLAKHSASIDVFYRLNNNPLSSCSQETCSTTGTQACRSEVLYQNPNCTTAIQAFKP